MTEDKGFTINDRRTSGGNDIKDRSRKSPAQRMRETDRSGEPSSVDKLSPSLPTWFKMAVAAVFPLCLLAGVIYFKHAYPDAAYAVPKGLMIGSVAAVCILFALVMLWILLIHIVERRWLPVKPLIAGLAVLVVVSAAGYCLVGWQGIFGSWALAAGAALIIFSVRELARGKYDEKQGEGATRDAGLVLIGLVICVFIVLELRSVWNEQYEKTGKAWYVPVLMNGPQNGKSPADHQ